MCCFIEPEKPTIKYGKLLNKLKCTAFVVKEKGKVPFMVCYRNYGWEMIAENAFSVSFKITEVFSGCTEHERSQTQIYIHRAMQWSFKNVFHGEKTRITTRI